MEEREINLNREKRAVVGIESLTAVLNLFKGKFSFLRNNFMSLREQVDQVNKRVDGLVDSRPPPVIPPLEKVVNDNPFTSESTLTPGVAKSTTPQFPIRLKDVVDTIQNTMDMKYRYFNSVKFVNVLII